MDVTVEWGSRSQTKPLLHRFPGPSFWLMPTNLPVAVGLINPSDVANWDTAPVMALPVRPNTGKPSIIAVVPPDISFIRLDFDLTATAGGVTKNVLSFRQFFMVSAQGTSMPQGTLLPSQFSIEDYVLSPSTSGPIRKAGKSITGRRRFLGRHPLLDIVPGHMSIDVEFVDATELWWAIRKDKLGWYLHPDLGGRQENLRVLAWTGGGAPMIWFAVVPDSAVSALDVPAQSNEQGGMQTGATAPSNETATPADVLFFRPPPGVNSFFYEPTADGFAHTEHDEKTMYILARYLLSPIPANRFPAIVQGSTVKRPDLLADIIQPSQTNPTQPADPMDLNFTSVPGLNILHHKFRPVGLEAALNRANFPRVMFLPLVAGDTGHGYEAAVLPYLKETVKSALLVLWNTNAIARNATAPPNIDQRELWLAGHSAGNLSMWTCLQNNSHDVSRVITFDAAPKSGPKANLATGIVIIKAANTDRKKAGKTLDVFVITTPNLTQNAKTGLDDQTDQELRGTGASVTVLPDFAQRQTYWELPPPPPAPLQPIKNVYIHYLLQNWSDQLIQKSAATPSNWFFLFFHEMAIFGGELALQPGATSPVLRTFFEMALGPPNPRPP